MYDMPIMVYVDIYALVCGPLIFGSHVARVEEFPENCISSGQREQNMYGKKAVLDQGDTFQLYTTEQHSIYILYIVPNVNKEIEFW